MRLKTSTTEQTPAAIEATPFDDGALYDLFFAYCRRELATGHLPKINGLTEQMT